MAQELETAAQADWNLESIGYLSKKWSTDIIGSGMVLGSQSEWEECGIYWERPDLRLGQEPGTILQKDG